MGYQGKSLGYLPVHNKGQRDKGYMSLLNGKPTQNIQHKCISQPEGHWKCTCGMICSPDTQETRNCHLYDQLANGEKLVKQMIYLASPHSHTLTSVRDDRYKAALKCTSWLIEKGYWCFSPIVHSHNLPCGRDEKVSFEFWRDFDVDTIRRMDEVWVLLIPGTKESKGVRAEIGVAKRLGRPIWAIQVNKPNDYIIKPWNDDYMII